MANELFGLVHFGLVCIRFRFGLFAVNPVIDGHYHFEIPIIEHFINDDYAGTIPDQFREKWLEEAKLKALEFYESNNNEH